MQTIIKIEKIVHNGYGLGHMDDKVVFVTNVLAQEEVSARVLSSNKNTVFAIPEKIIHASPDRIDPPCPHYPLCGGCQFLHTSYENQLKIKEEVLLDFLTPLNPLEITKFVPSPKSMHYKLSAHFQVHHGKACFSQRHSHNPVEIKECLLLDERINQFIKGLKSESIVTDCVVKADNQGHLSSNLYHQKKKHLNSRLGDLFFQYDFRTFFQSNKYLVEPWLELIREEAEKYNLKRVLDLYCGIGIITLYLARSLPVQKITGLEIDNTAVNFAKQNRESNKIFHAHFQAGDVLRTLTNYENASLVLLNPPRGGAGPEVIHQITRLRPEAVIFSSCEISNFIRDALDLAEQGYQCQKVIPMDMFPHTFHFEIIGVFTK